ncbi:MAG: hypothetical protein EXR60_00305 [Dehalococcoidia bacterium]|nr:hypothetical protein [Dehalococcoidia bacterium]
MVEQKSQKPQEARYDYIRHLREEFALLELELKEKGVAEGLAEVAQRFSVSPELALAAVHRASKRSGYNMRLFIEQFKQQVEAEKRAPGGAAAAQGPRAPGKPG